MEEQWRPIPGYPGYEASDHGNLRSIMREIMVGGKRQTRRGMSLTPVRSRNGRLYVRMNAHVVMVAKVIAVTWLDTTWDYCPQHIDGNKWNLHPDNLKVAEEKV